MFKIKVFRGFDRFLSRVEAALGSKTMSRLKVFLGYAVAALGLPIVLATFMGQAFWMQSLVSATGWRISPWFTGDVVAQTVSHDGYEIRIHRPVFLALIGERPEGFVQVDFAPPGYVPAQVAEEIDYDGDGQTDFRLELDTKTRQARLTPYTAAVMGVRGVYRLKDAWAVRVDVKNSKS